MPVTSVINWAGIRNKPTTVAGAGLTDAAPILSASVAATSGTAIDFTSIPAWVSRITLMINGVSTTGGSSLCVRLGTSGGVEATGYAGAASNIGSTVTSTNSTTDVVLENGGAATDVRHGVITITKIGSNAWAIAGVIGRSDGNSTRAIAATKTLAGTLDRVRVTTQAGTDTFDAGSLAVMWE